MCSPIQSVIGILFLFFVIYTLAALIASCLVKKYKNLEYDVIAYEIPSVLILSFIFFSQMVDRISG